MRDSFECQLFVFLFLTGVLCVLGSPVLGPNGTGTNFLKRVPLQVKATSRVVSRRFDGMHSHRFRTWRDLERVELNGSVSRVDAAKVDIHGGITTVGERTSFLIRRESPFNNRASSISRSSFA